MILESICLCLVSAGIGAVIGAETQDKGRNIMAKLSELAGSLNASLALVTKVLSEVSKLSADFESLKAQFADADVPAEAQVIFDSINAKLAALDAINPDIEPPVEPPQA